MAKFPFEAFTRVSWVPTIASMAAPTVAELTAGTDISCFLTKDGLNLNASTAESDSGTLCTQLEGKSVGAVTVSPELRMYRDSVIADDDAWALWVYGTNGYLVVRYGVAYATAWTAAQLAQVYKGQMHEPVMNPSAVNTSATFNARCTVQEFNQKAVVAA